MSVPDNLLSPPANYDDCLSNLKKRIRRAQTRAALAVNQELISNSKFRTSLRHFSRSAFLKEA